MNAGSRSIQTGGDGKLVSLFTDGACSSNPGPGGWAVVFMDGDDGLKQLSGLSKSTTNNKMELKAAIEAYKHVLTLKVSDPRDKTEYEIVSDSAYVVNTVSNGWLQNWKRNGWKNGKGEKVKNIGLWKEMQFLIDVANAMGVNVSFRKVRGHAGNPMNEIADRVAVNRKLEAIQMLGGN